MFHLAETQLEAGCSLILDNSFDPSLSTSRFPELKTRYNVEAIQLVCDSDQETLVDRFRARAEVGNRHPRHGDNDVLGGLRAYLAREMSLAMDIGGSVIEIDTTDFYTMDYGAILDAVRRAMLYPPLA